MASRRQQTLARSFVAWSAEIVIAGAGLALVLPATACRSKPDDKGTAATSRSPLPAPGAIPRAPAAGPSDYGANHFVHPKGDAARGREVFRFETFGNEGFWTRALRLPQGIAAKHLTLGEALRLGLGVDIDRVPPPLRAKLAGGRASAMNDPALMAALLEANAVIGLVAKNVKALDGTLEIDERDVYAGESLGVSCAFCHATTDGSVYAAPGGGSIGKEIDGPANHRLDVGATFAMAAGSRAMLPMLGLQLAANESRSVTRKGAAQGLISPRATEAEVDAYLGDPARYPRGTFDLGLDANGAPLHIAPLFRADLAAPWGTDGAIAKLQDFDNFFYTGVLDPTGITTPGGRRFAVDRLGPAGTEMVDEYERVLGELGVAKGGPTGYPFVGREGRSGVATGLPAGAKVAKSLLGIRVDEAKLTDLNAYLDGLPPPRGKPGDPAAVARGRAVFRAQCTQCHNDDQSKFVPQNVVAYGPSVDLFAAAPPRPPLFAGYDGALLADRKASGLVPIRNAPGTFDDALIVMEASSRGLPRGSALPVLFDLAHKPAFLHDDSIASLEALFDPAGRSASSPHAFFVPDPAQRRDLVHFLESLDDRPLPAP
jgi:mono/diheme cytochrome c family protein